MLYRLARCAVSEAREDECIMAPLEVTTIAGSGEYGHLDGLGTAAKFQAPRGLTFDSAGNLIVCDFRTNCIR